MLGKSEQHVEVDTSQVSCTTRVMESVLLGTVVGVGLACLVCETTLVGVCDFVPLLPPLFFFDAVGEADFASINTTLIKIMHTINKTHPLLFILREYENDIVKSIRLSLVKQ